MPRVLSARALLAMLVGGLCAGAVAMALSGPYSTLAIAGVSGFLLAALLTLAFDRWVSRPLDELVEVAHKIAGGDLRARVRSRRDDEVGHLGRAIDRIADRLDERLAAQAREDARRGAILDAMVEAVLVTDAEGRIAVSNAAFVELVGGAPIGRGELRAPQPEGEAPDREALRAPTALTGRTVMEAVRSPELDEAVRKATGGKKQRASVTIVSEHRTRLLDATVSPLPASAGVVVVLHDVTELRRTDAVRRDFVANASHELRTPLTSIRGFAETLEGGAMGDAAVARRFVHGIVENANRLQRLVDDLLELSRAESPEAAIELRPIAVADVAAKVLRALEGRARDRRTQLALEPGGKVLALADERALDQVLMNLVENAIKYTPEGGHVWIRATASAEHVLVSVKDDGPGIAEQHLPRLFERFYRVDHGRAREQGGTGLGLAIVKHLVGRLRGEVSVESRIGKGTTFTVKLARAEVRPDAAAAPS